LAFLARISRPTASEHLAKLVTARLLTVSKKRRFNYYRIASPLVAQMLESLIAVAAIEVPPRHQPRSPQDERLRFARTCYDHVAGRLGVAMADALVAKQCVVLDEDGGEVTEAGRRFFCDFGVDLTARARSRRIFCRPCLDWSERRHHIAGLVGAAMCRRCLELGWVSRERHSRALRITPTGDAGFRATFGLSLHANERREKISA
jgi:hypothetical protein